MCIFNRGSNRGWADIQGKPLSLFDQKAKIYCSQIKLIYSVWIYGRQYVIGKCPTSFPALSELDCMTSQSIPYFEIVLADDLMYMMTEWLPVISQNNIKVGVFFVMSLWYSVNHGLFWVIVILWVFSHLYSDFYVNFHDGAFLIPMCVCILLWWTTQIGHFLHGFILSMQ